MTIGDKSIFAIESTITYAYEHLSLRALGYFVIHICGHCYGVKSPDATMLACSLDEVQNRITRRGNHTAPFSVKPSASEVGDAIRRAIYAPDQEGEQFFGIPHATFQRIIFSNHLLWAPDGDEAFDDGSYVLHFDVGNQVRLIAFKSRGESYDSDPATISSIWLQADKYYNILEQWRNAFETEWAATPKTIVAVK